MGDAEGPSIEETNKIRAQLGLKPLERVVSKLTKPEDERKMNEDEQRMGYEVSTDKKRLDIEVVVGFLARAYWSKTRTREQVIRSIEHSLCWGVYHKPSGQMVAFARVVSDCSTFAWLCDVFVDESHRGHGLGKLLVASVLAHPDLQGLRRYLLATADAHGLYRQFGFRPLHNPDRWMEIDRSIVPAPTRSKL